MEALHKVLSKQVNKNDFANQKNDWHRYNSAVHHLIEHPAHIQTSMTLPPDPTLFLAHCKAHKADTPKPTLHRAKNTNAQPTNPG